VQACSAQRTHQYQANHCKNKNRETKCETNSEWHRRVILNDKKDAYQNGASSRRQSKSRGLSQAF
jgi:hypothetical protein